MSHLPNEGCVGTALMDTNILSAGGGMGKQEHQASSRFFLPFQISFSSLQFFKTHTAWPLTALRGEPNP